MGRLTNLALLALLGGAFLTGWVAFSFGTTPARWSLVVHALSGFAIVAVIPWKALIARRGLARRRKGWWVSVVLAVLILASLAGGLLHSTGLLPWWGPYTAMELHVGAAIAAVPFAAMHVARRPVKVRLADMSRRALLKAGVVTAMAGAGYAASEGLVRRAGLAGAGRRFTGSYEAGSFQPDMMPVSSWMFDPIPVIDADSWRLVVAGRAWSYRQLAGFDDRLRAVLDCTGGFYSEQDWEGAWLSRLVDRASSAGALSVRVVSETGYDRRFPLEDMPRLLLATRLGGRPLEAAHGHPVRLVAPDRRGFWWVKWVTKIEVDAVPHWFQPPFPLQ